MSQYVDDVDDLLESRYSRRQVVQGALVAGAAFALRPSDAWAAAPKPRRGGRVRIGFIGSSSDVWDPYQNVSFTDVVRLRTIWNRLGEIKPGTLDVVPALAESWEPNKDATQWTVRLKQGVEFHNGKTVTADDILWSYRRVQRVRGGLDALNLRASKKIDKRTVRFQLKQPNALFQNIAGENFNAIIPAGQDAFSPRNLVGTGPWMVKRISPGQRFVLARNPNYWESGLPYLDEVEVIYFADGAALLNALFGGQIDAMPGLPPNEVARARRAGFVPLMSRSGSWTPIVMNTTQAPFDDVRVRKALKLAVDRKLVVSNVYGGFATLANDVPGFGSSDYFADELTQHQYDPEQAKALLRQAGWSDLKLKLESGEATRDMLPLALVFARSARDAGVTVEVANNPGAGYWTDTYLKAPFYHSQWGGRTFDAITSLTYGAQPAFNETKWVNKQFADLVTSARRTLDEKRRNRLFKDAQRILHDQGGYIIPAFSHHLDVSSPKFAGWVKSPFRELGSSDWRRVYKKA